MKKLNRNILVGITSLILICPFLIPITKAQEWIYDGVDTTNIPDFSVYPSEWYVLNATGAGVPDEILIRLVIENGNITDPFSAPDNGTCVWGDLWMVNATSGEGTLTASNMLHGYWNETVGYLSGNLPFIIPVENNGIVSSQILNNVSVFMGMMVAGYNLEHQQVYPNIYSIALWNTTDNDAYLHLNYTDDGILTNYESYLLLSPPSGNITLYSQPAQQTPVFSLSTDDDILTINSTDFKIATTITDADNNNDGVTDTDYLFRIFNGSTWTSWAVPTSLLDWDLGSVAAGNYTITMEVKNMYGVTQEQVTFEYIPPEDITDGDEIISSYPIFLVSMVAILGISIIIYRNRKKLRI